MGKESTYGAPGVAGRSATARAAAPSRLLLSLFALAVSVLLSSSAGAAGEQEGMVRSNPHELKAQQFCSVCHKGEPPELNMDPMATCTKCHNGNVTNHPVSRHPLGVAPKMNVPSYLPLSKDGKMVCYTCHDPHNKSGLNNMLRVTFIKLCASCHAGY